MELTEKFLFFSLNIIAIALPVALLEILLEKNTGWGSSFPKDKWYGKIIGINNKYIALITKIVGIPYFFGYLIFMYFFIIPAMLILEYLFLIQNLFLLIAVYFAILATEDFLWFLLNWNFNSLTELLKGPDGSIWWHKKWIKIFKKTYIPRSYLISAILVIILFILS